MSNPNLYLVGTIHFDIDGYMRLATLLELLSPPNVALEFSEDRLPSDGPAKPTNGNAAQLDQLLEERGLVLTPAQKKTFQEINNRMLSVWGFELKAAQAYVERTPGATLHFVDLSLYRHGKEDFQTGYVQTLESAFQAGMQSPEAKDDLLGLLDKGPDGYWRRYRADIQQAYAITGSLIHELTAVIGSDDFEQLKHLFPPNVRRTIDQILNPERNNAMSEGIRRLYNGSDMVVAVMGLMHLSFVGSMLKDLDPTIVRLDEYITAVQALSQV